MTSTLRRTSNGSAAPGSTGRSSSQISIYDYPEHLNPFHEDDNHKRIRFWKMSTSNKQAGRDRSNSFSLNGLKEMWAFKSFRLKKRSSTLGINKTSESPPQLRRPQPHDSTTSDASAQLFDSRIRHTVNGNGASSHFDRGAGYRSSLQNVHSNGGSTSTINDHCSTIGFHRNDGYRSTIQNGYQTTPAFGGRRGYVHNGGSVTPTPERSGLSHGLSQSSLNSTNPFDGDDDDERMNFGDSTNEDNVSRVTVNVVSDGAGGVRKVYRKKRRAPPPPPPRTSSVTDAMHTSQSETAATSITTVPETSRENSLEDEEQGRADISQLAAQIASFVLDADTDREQLPNGSADVEPPTPETTHTITNSNSDTTVHVQVEVHRPASVQQPPSRRTPTPPRRALEPSERGESPVQVEVHRPASVQQPPSRRTPTPPRRALEPSERGESPENNAAYPRDSPERSAAALHKTDSEKQLNTLERVTPRIVVRSATGDDDDDDDTGDKCVTLEKQPLPAVPASTTTTSTTTTTVVRIVDQPRRQTVVHSLHIAESTDDLTATTPTIDATRPATTPPVEEEVIGLKITESAEDVRKPNAPPDTTTPVDDPERYKIRFVALKPSTSTKPTPSANKPKWTSPWSSIGSGSSKRSTSANAIPNATVPDDVQLRGTPRGRSAGTDDETEATAVAAPPRRRRSVKDIIESINKCQSLLRINQTDAAGALTVDKRVTSLDTLEHGHPVSSYNNNNNTNGGSVSTEFAPPSASNESIVRNLVELQASEQQIRETISEMENGQRTVSDRNNNNNNINSTIQPPNGRNNNDGGDDDNNYEDINDVLHQLPIMVERYAEFSSEFKKCSGPLAANNTSSPEPVRRREKTRTDWNPLPKPRRSRNLTQEAAERAAASTSSSAQ